MIEVDTKPTLTEPTTDESGYIVNLRGPLIIMLVLGKHTQKYANVDLTLPPRLELLCINLLTGEKSTAS